MDKHPFDNGELVIRDEVLAAIPRVPDEIKKHIMEYYARVTHVERRVGRYRESLERNGQNMKIQSSSLPAITDWLSDNTV